MLKTRLKFAFLLLCAIGWFVFLSQLTFDPRLIGDITLWGSLLSITLGLSAWARFSLRSKAAQAAYDVLFMVVLFYTCLYAFYRGVFYLIFDMFLQIPVSQLVASGFVLPFLIWTLIHSHVIPILMAHDKIALAKRYLAAMQQHYPQSVELCKQKIMLVRQQGDEQAMLDEIARIISVHFTPRIFFASFPSEADYFLALLHLTTETNEKALDNARALMRFQENLDLAFIQRGIAFLFVNDLDAAAADLEHALRFTTRPQRKVIAEVNLGIIDYILENDKAAQQHWSRALAIPLLPNDTCFYIPRVYVLMGLMAFHRGDAGKAWHNYRTALKINPQSIEARAGMAVLHAAHDHWETAIKIWRGLRTEHAYFADPDEVIRRHFRWTPPMAEGVRQITEHLNPLRADDTADHAEESRETLVASH